MNTPVVIMETHPAWTCPRCAWVNVLIPEIKPTSPKVQAFIAAELNKMGEDGHVAAEASAVFGVHQTCAECELEVNLRPPFIGLEP